MYKSYIILILILTFSCSQKQSNSRIIKFEKILGERETKSLNSLVYDFEKNLDNIYPDLSIEKAYQQYLADIISDSITNGGKFEFQSEKTNAEFNESGLWKEIYTKDAVSGLQVNQVGKYMRALYEIKDTDSLIKKYWNARDAIGMIQNEIVVNGILRSNPDFNDYFHKRIVILEFSF